MPRTEVELSQERLDRAEALARRRRAQAAAAAPPTDHERHHRRERDARLAASRCGCPNTEVGAVPTADAAWVGVVFLRPDQAWMAAAVRERGCRPVIGEQP